MNLAEMLSYTDINELNRIAKNYECQCNGNSKNELIQSILSTVTRKDIMERQVMQLSVEEIRLLNSLISDQRDYYSLEELVARVNQAKLMSKQTQETNNPRETITEFKHRGWLFNGYSQQTKYLFQIPVDLKNKFRDALNKQFLLQIETLSEFPAVYREEQGLLLEDILYFLKFVQQQNVQLSAEGYMYKRMIQQIMECYTVSESPVAKSAWRFGYGRRFKEYPSRVSFIYDYCFFHDLISENDSYVTITDLGRNRVLTGQKEDLQQVYRFWLRLYKSAIPNVQSIVQWIDCLAKSWITFRSLSDVICKLIKPFYYDTPESILEQRIVQMMMHLGLLRIGKDEQVGSVLQISKLGSSVIAGIYVQEEDKIELKLNKKLTSSFSLY